MSRLPVRYKVALALCGVALAAVLRTSGAQGETGRHLSPQARLDLIRKAQVWRGTDVPAADMITGPTGEGAFAPHETVQCTYEKRRMAGNTPKFTCVLGKDDEMKVKYGPDNGEVYAEVAATRLFWALGFGADRMYSVKVICHKCPFDEVGQPRSSKDDAVFDPAAIERKMSGHTLESHTDSGWTWNEIDLVDEGAGGAPRAHRDALKLLAAVVQHTDSKAEQQRLVCLSGKAEDGTCARPFMLISDLGQTFGRANAFNRSAVGSVNLEKWASTPVWKDPSHCVANLSKSITGTLENPRISEGGRAFLAGLLTQLTDKQIHDMFEVARVWLRSADPKRAGTADEWAAAFAHKRDEVSELRCPQS